MKCECCKDRNIEIEEPTDIPEGPFRLCKPCHHRLINLALRPLEFFNLAAIHGADHFLHDDFYDDQTGEAMQPKVDVIEPGNFPFPDFETIKNDIDRLVDFAFVQLSTKEYVFDRLKQFNKKEIVATVDKKVKYNRGINYKAYEMVAEVVGVEAEHWVKNEWLNRRPHEFSYFAKALIKCLPFDEAFEALTNEIERMDDRSIPKNIFALRYLESDRTLDWIERIIPRIDNISESWGVLAATSKFSWVRADKWLGLGRPLSLIAIDALYLCTQPESSRHESSGVQKPQYKLTDAPLPEVIATRLNEYLLIDNVPRTKASINRIIENVFMV
jgi:hypothetical protein